MSKGTQGHATHTRGHMRADEDYYGKWTVGYLPAMWQQAHQGSSNHQPAEANESQGYPVGDRRTVTLDT